MLELCKDLFNGIEIGTVRRQEEEPCTSLADGGSDGLSLVAAKIVHDHDVTKPEAGNQYLFDIEQEPLSIDRSVEGCLCSGRGNLVAAQGCKERHGFPMAMRHMAEEPLAFEGPTAQWRHVGQPQNGEMKSIVNAQLEGDPRTMVQSFGSYDDVLTCEPNL